MAIEVGIVAHPSGGLRVIPRIPAERPCRLEGRNGVGKSVAVRLLSLASGDQPYADDPSAWRSLRQLLGNVEMTFTGLAGGASSARLTMTPDSWPEEPELEIGEWLGELWLDGKPHPCQELFQRLDVVHLSGTERLIDTVTRRLSRFATALQVTRARLERIEEQRAVLGEIADEFAFVSPARARQDDARRVDLERQLRLTADELSRLHQRMNALQRAATLVAMIAASTSADRAAELEAALREAEEARQEFADADRALTRAVQALGQGNKEQKALATLERRLTKLRSEVETARARRTTLATELGLSDVAGFHGDVLSEDLRIRVQTLLRTVELELEDAEREAYESNLSEAETRIRDELTVVLQSAIDGGHSDFVVARIDDRDVSVRDFSQGVAEAARASVPEANEQLAELRARYTSLGNLLDANQTIVATLARIVDLEVEISAQKEKVPGQDALEVAVNDARAQREIAGQRARMAALRVGQISAGTLNEQSKKDAQKEVDDLVASQSTSVDELHRSLTEGTSRLAELQTAIADLQRSQKGIRDDDARRRVMRRTLTSRLRQDASLRWVREVMVQHDEPTDDEWQTLADRMEAARQRAQALVRDVEALEASATTNAQAGVFVDALRSLLQLEALEDFADRHITAALFDDGQVEQLDLRDQSITWRTADGERRSRPLSAFSSGEQALGFIRARLRQVAVTDAVNRLIFLDEFGAFVAADQRKPLADLLTDDELNPLSSQIIVMLPMQADYASELDQTRGELHERYEARAASIEAVGYFAEKFVS